MLSGQRSSGNSFRPLHVLVERPVREEAEEARDHDRVVEPPLLDVGLADHHDAGPGLALEVALHRRQRHRLVTGDELRLLVARRERDQHARHEARDDSEPEKPRRVVDMEALERVVGADRRHHEGGRDDAGHHVVRVLREGPRVEQEGPEVAELQGAVGGDDVAHRVLHERVGADDEVAGQPAPGEQGQGGEEVPARTEAPLAEDQEPEEARLQEEREQAFHREGVADDPAGIAGEVGPVGAELELHRDARDDADGEVDAEDADPESRGVVPPAVSGAEADRLHDDDEQRQAHRQLREQVVEHDRERELQSMPEERVGQAGSLPGESGAAQRSRDDGAWPGGAGGCDTLAPPPWRSP